MNNEKHETFCNYNLTNLLLKVGFDWQDYFVAHDINEHFHWEIPLHIAQKWLREVKNTFIDVDSSEAHIGFSLGISVNYVPDENPVVYVSEPDGTLNVKRYSTYEEALEDGIKRCLKILLGKAE